MCIGTVTVVTLTGVTRDSRAQPQRYLGAVSGIQKQALKGVPLETILCFWGVKLRRNGKLNGLASGQSVLLSVTGHFVDICSYCWFGSNWCFIHSFVQVNPIVNSLLWLKTCEVECTTKLFLSLLNAWLPWSFSNKPPYYHIHKHKTGLHDLGCSLSCTKFIQK